jgi:hypothetical protein
VVESLPSKQMVAGSNPVPRSSDHQQQGRDGSVGKQRTKG